MRIRVIVNITCIILAAMILCSPLSTLKTFAEDAAAVSAQEKTDLDFADGLYQRGMYANASNQYAAFLKKHPVSSLGSLALFRQGESLYQQASKKLTDDPVAYKVALLKTRGLFQEWLRLYPAGERLHEALLRYGEVCYKLDDAKTGLETLQKVVKQSKDASVLEAALFYSARCYESLGDDKNAMTRYGQIRSTYPNGEFSAFAIMLQSEILARQGKPADAVKQLDDIWKNPSKYKIPNDSDLVSEAQIRSAQILYKLDKFEEASQAYQAYAKAHPSGDASAKALYGAAWAEYQRKNYAKALELARALQRESLTADLRAGILFLKGTCSYQQKSYEDAILFFREVIADPGAGEYRERAWYQLAWSNYLSKKYDAAIKESQNLLKQGLSPEMSSNVHFLAGQSYAQKLDYKLAIGELRVSLEISTSGEYGEESLYLLADLLYRSKMYSEAGDAFEKYYDAYPKSARAQESLSWAANSRFAGKEYQRAVDVAERLLKDYPDLQNRHDVLYRKALAQYQIKKYDGALVDLNTILQSEDDESRKPEALYWRAYIYEIQGKKQEASAAYGQLLKRYPLFKDREEVRLRKALCDYQTKQFSAAYEGFYGVLFTDRGVRLPTEIIFWMIITADERDDHTEALEIAKRILDIFEEPQIQERAYIGLGNQLVALGEWKDVLANAETFLTRFPKSLFQAEIFHTRARAFEGLGDKTKAMEWYEKSLVELQKLGNPDTSFEAVLFMDRGRLFDQLNRTGDALECFLRVAIIYDHPELTPEALYRSMRCHRALNEAEEIKTLYAELQKRYPHSQWAMKAQAEFKSEKSEPAPMTDVNQKPKDQSSGS